MFFFNFILKFYYNFQSNFHVINLCDLKFCGLLNDQIVEVIQYTVHYNKLNIKVFRNHFFITIYRLDRPGFDEAAPLPRVLLVLTAGALPRLLTAVEVGGVSFLIV